jgi:translation initiation factor IF-3
MIRVPEVRLVGESGTMYGIVSINEARLIAQREGLDLVEISPNAKPPVVKVIDYGKYKYHQQKLAADAKKKMAVVQLKEIQLRPNIEEHDLETKLKKVREFLEDGDKIKMVMQFRGRENTYKAAGMEKFKGILEKVMAFGAMLEAEPKMMGPRIIAIIAPDKKVVVKGKTKPSAENKAPTP